MLHQAEIATMLFGGFAIILIITEMGAWFYGPFGR
jgi:hypothetical protein